MLKKMVLLSLLLVLSASCFGAQGVCIMKSHPAINMHKDWQLAVQAWTFNRFTFDQMIDKASALGLSWIEAYPGQPLGGEFGEAKFGPEMTADQKKWVKAKIADAVIGIAAYGVVNIPADEAQAREIYEFAKEMGIAVLTSEPKADAFDTIEKLCIEYDIKVAMHTHTKAGGHMAKNWNPYRWYALCQGRNYRVGLCIDTGHIARSGMKPAQVVADLHDRIISLHLKDVEKFNADSEDVIFGTGGADMGDVFRELDKWGFKGALSIEYESNMEDNFTDVHNCILFYEKIAKEIQPCGWQNMLSGDLSVWTFDYGKWKIDENSVIEPISGGLWSKGRYGDFILDMEFKVVKNGNSGVFLRCGNVKDWFNTSFEVQIHDNPKGDGSPKGQCGAIYDCMEPSEIAVKPTGQWNHFTITCVASKIYVVLNGVAVIDMDFNDWKEAGKNPDGSANKFKNIAYKDMSREGHIGLQDHHDKLWIRNIRIKPLD